MTEHILERQTFRTSRLLDFCLERELKPYRGSISLFATAGFTAVMARRREPPDALDYFPTPPWATRALFRRVLPALGGETIASVWEPACGEGHMAEVVTEFARGQVIASDIFNYGLGKRTIFSVTTRLGGLSGSARTRRSWRRASSRCGRSIWRAKGSPCSCGRNGLKESDAMRSCSAIDHQRSTRHLSSACLW
jgi:hypothetical protein